MTAHDVRHLRVCPWCNKIGDGREMVLLTGGHTGSFHGRCVTEVLSHDQILALPSSERGKFRLSDVSPELMRKLLDVY